MSRVSRSRLVVAAAIAVLGWANSGTTSLANPSLVFDSHVNATPNRDGNAFYLRITNTGTPVTILGFTVNNRCHVDLYQKAVPAMSPSGDVTFYALTADQATRMITPDHKNWAALVKTPLVIKPGDHPSVIIPAVAPLMAFGGFLGAGSCGMSLERFKAETDAGEVDWPTAP